MTYSQVELGFMLTLYGWLPICFIVFTYMIYRVAKKLLKNKSIREASLNDRNKIAMTVLWYSIPALLLLIIMVIPTFYFNHLIKQDDYCQKIIQVNKITTTDDQFLQELCDQFDLDELLVRAHQP